MEHGNGKPTGEICKKKLLAQLIGYKSYGTYPITNHRKKKRLGKSKFLIVFKMSKMSLPVVQARGLKMMRTEIMMIIFFFYIFFELISRYIYDNNNAVCNRKYTKCQQL